MFVLVLGVNLPELPSEPDTETASKLLALWRWPAGSTDIGIFLLNGNLIPGGLLITNPS
jgi:hypothetical protein